MGRISRLRTITKTRIEAFLASLEKPETVLPQLMKEMEEKVKEAARAEAKALSAVKADRRRLDAGVGKVIRYEKGAMLAVQAGEIDTAKRALAAQIQAEKEVEKYKENLSISESAYSSAKLACTRLGQNLKELKLKKKEIIERSRQLRVAKSLNRTAGFPGDKGKNILDQIARMETRIEEAEEEIEIQNEITQTLGVSFPFERVKVLESDTEVDNRLSELKKRIKQDSE